MLKFSINTGGIVTAPSAITKTEGSPFVSASATMKTNNCTICEKEIKEGYILNDKDPFCPECHALLKEELKNLCLYVLGVEKAISGDRMQGQILVVSYVRLNGCIIRNAKRVVRG